MTYDRENLDAVFANVERIDDGRFAVYKVLDKYGSDAGMITCMSGNEIRIYVDNFPAQKKYYSSNYPIETVDQFEIDIARTGLNLMRKDS
jgi:hypothetical protein